MSFKILCTVSGGVTGHREGWLKDAAGLEMVYPTVQEAARVAAHLARVMNHPLAQATFTYEVSEVN